MPLTTVWGNANPNVSDAPNDANDDLNNGFQASCGGAANPEPLDYYLHMVGECIQALEARTAADIPFAPPATGSTVGSTNVQDAILALTTEGDDQNATEVPLAPAIATGPAAGVTSVQDALQALNTAMENNPDVSLSSADGFITFAHSGANDHAVVLTLNTGNLFSSTAFRNAVNNIISSRWSLSGGVLCFDRNNNGSTTS